MGLIQLFIAVGMTGVIAHVNSCYLGDVEGIVFSKIIDVFQVKEVKDDAVALPDDGWPQRPADAARQDGAEAHCDGGDADPLLLGQAELDHLRNEISVWE